MAEDRGATIIGDRIEIRLDRLGADVTDLKVDVSELKGTVSQILKRASNLENMQRWAFGVMVGTWVTLMLAVLGLYFKR